MVANPPPIVDQDLWDRVQQSLREHLGSARTKRTRQSSEALLAGKLFDDRGTRRVSSVYGWPLRWRESNRTTRTPSPPWSRGRTMGSTSSSVWLRGTWGALGRDTLELSPWHRSCASCLRTITRACARRPWQRWRTSQAKAHRRRAVSGVDLGGLSLQRWTECAMHTKRHVKRFDRRFRAFFHAASTQTER